MESNKTYHIASVCCIIAGVCSLITAIVAKVWCHYISAVIWAVMAVITWDEVLEIEN